MLGYPEPPPPRPPPWLVFGSCYLSPDGGGAVSKTGSDDPHVVQTFFQAPQGYSGGGIFVRG